MESSELSAHAGNDAAGAPCATPSIHDLGAYLEAGLQLIPLHRWNATDAKGRARGKSPRDRAWQTRPYDNKQVIAGVEKGGNVGVRLTAEWLVLDVDPRNFPEGRDCLREFVEAVGIDLSSVPRTRTGSGGDHYWFRKPADLPVLDSLEQYRGIEFKSAGRQVVAAGSIHPNGNRYELDDFAPPVKEAPHAPAGLLQAVRRPDRAVAGPREPGELSPAKLAETLEQLQPEDFRDHDEWLKLMMACHHATGGEGREEFIEWSTGDPEYADDAWMIGRRWDSLHANPGTQPITINYLHKVVQERGGFVAVPDPEDDFGPYETTDDEPKAASARWRFLSIEDLEAMPSPAWLVPGVLTEGSLGAIYGPPESFKSFLALDMALSIASGLAWHGQAVRAGGALYIAGEGSSGLKKRVRSWKTAHGIADGAIRFRLMIDEVNLASENAAHVREFVESVKRVLGPLKLIVIDTLNQTAAGADENSAKDMSRFIASMKRLRDATGAAVVVVHHSGKDASKGMRGSTALLGAMDTTVEVERRTDAAMIASVRKQKDAERASPMHFNVVPCGDSCVLKRTVMGDPAADFVGTASALLDLAADLALAGGGRIPQKVLVAELMNDGTKERTARRKIEDAIPEDRGSAKRASDGTILWLERLGRNPRGELSICAER